jgi:short-subunit dehydrogenase
MILRNKNVLITGATGGLGRALAQAYLKKGCNLYLTGRDTSKLKALANELNLQNNYDYRINFQACDFEINSSVDTMISEAKKTIQRIDILINCAGTFPISKIHDMNLEEYQKCIQINLNVPFLLIREFSKEMIKNKWGRIINIASSGAYAGGISTSVYCASKHALLGLSRSLHKELKKDGVRVFCVSPGTIQTEMAREVEKLGQLYDTFMTPEEVADYIAYTTSYDGQMVSEEIILNRLFVQ